MFCDLFHLYYVIKKKTKKSLFSALNVIKRDDETFFLVEVEVIRVGNYYWICQSVDVINCLGGFVGSLFWSGLYLRNDFELEVEL